MNAYTVDDDVPRDAMDAPYFYVLYERPRRRVATHARRDARRRLTSTRVRSTDVCEKKSIHGIVYRVLGTSV